MKKYKVFWTIEATADLEEIFDYIAKERPSAAKSVFKKIKARCRELTASPERNRSVRELAEIGIHSYRELISSPYRIVYRISEKTVYIIAVIDGRRDFETVIFNRLIRG